MGLNILNTLLFTTQKSMQITIIIINNRMCPAFSDGSVYIVDNINVTL